MHPGELQQAAQIIRRGGLVAYPTEYCFGLGCDPFNRDAVLRLLRLKRRPVAKGLILIAADVSQVMSYVENIPGKVIASWPGPHTWLLEPRAGVPGWITGQHPRIAVRITAHPTAAALCKAAGMALVSTSANRGGGVPARTDREVVRLFGKEIDFVVSGMVGAAPTPTPIRDAVTGELVRPG
jgi:L-threonylcarbamoyladenylate synthase